MTMNFDTAIYVLNERLRKEQPEEISSSWISSRLPAVYQFIWRTIRTPLGDINWDWVISHLEWELQKLWHPQRFRRKAEYTDAVEVQIALGNYYDKRYVFFSAPTEVEWDIRRRICAIFARLAQRGNKTAEEEFLELLRFMVQKWMEYRPMLWRWKGYPEDLDKALRRCIHCYRYTGNFTSYLYISLIKAGRGLPKFYVSSLDKVLFDDSRTEVRRLDSVVQDPETGDIKLFERADYVAV